MTKPIRKRGFHRALKRRELWATVEDSMNKVMRFYLNKIVEDLFKPNPWDKLLKSQDNKKVKISYE